MNDYCNDLANKSEVVSTLGKVIAYYAQKEADSFRKGDIPSQASNNLDLARKCLNAIAHVGFDNFVSDSYNSVMFSILLTQYFRETGQTGHWR